MAEDKQNEQDPQPVGRPLTFKSVEELDAAIETFLGDCSPHKSKRAFLKEKDDGTTYWAVAEYMTDQKPITVSAAALALGVNRRTLLDYKEREEFLPSIERLLAHCEAYAESMLFTHAANGAKFNLINNYRGKYQAWAEKHEVSGPDGVPLMPLAIDSDILARNQGSEAPTPSPEADSPE